MHVIIVGGSLTGLTTALALEKLGISYHVYERFPYLAEVGAGIWLAPNAQRVLDWIGIGDEVRSAGKMIAEVSIANRLMQSLRHSIDDTFRTENSQLVAIHRARLQQILYNHIPDSRKSLGQAFQHYKEDNGSIVVTFAGQQVEGTHLAGADGLQSMVRQQLFPDSPLRYSGQTCWRGVSQMSLPRPWTEAAMEAWGPRKRFGFTPISPNEVYWFGVQDAPAGEMDPSGDKVAFLSQKFVGFGEPVHQLLQNTPGEKIFRSDLYDLKRLATWHRGRVCLLGDAGHATTPNMGQGAAQGMVDAYHFSKSLSQDPNPENAYAHFEKSRRAKVDYIVDNSWRMGKLAHHPLGQPLLKTILRITPASVLSKQMQNVYSIDN